MGRYIKTKADFTLRRKHKSGSGYTIYENDYTTINPMPNAMKGEYVIGDSNFVFTSRLGINAQRKHVRGKFVQPPLSGSAEELVAWTMDNMGSSSITTETKIRLKPNYTSIKDFACYGSAVKLVQGTANGVIMDFPAEMYLSDDDIKFYDGDDGVGYSFSEWDDENDMAKTPIVEGKILYNEYGIDITTLNVEPENIYNPLRYFTLCGNSYTYIDENGEAYAFQSFSAKSTALGTCSEGKRVSVDKVAECGIFFESGNSVGIDIYKDYDNGSTYYVHSGAAGAHIRPKKEIVEDYFMNCDDFTAVLLNRDNKPIYTATFETPKETETGITYDMVSYTWPSMNGGYNPDLSGPYFSYLEGLMDVGQFLDEYYTDNMWRSLTHEAIKALDWTYVSNSDGEIEDMSKIDTSRVEPITKIYGRQFDDLKRYADGIKSINTITYNQKSNTPDYTLTDILENSGWETKTLKLTDDNTITTESLYSGLTSGYTASDANNEFIRRLKLNSRYLFSIKGTRKGLDTMLALFGFTPEDYDIHEYVAVFSGDKGRYQHFCNKTEEIKDDPNLPNYPLAEDVKTINRYKISYNADDPYGPYCGVPVTEVGYWSGESNYSYVIPWFSYGKKYDDGLYFQMYGGWGKRAEMDVNLEIAPNVTSITGNNLYMETQARLKFARDFDEMLQQAFSSSHLNDIFYVTDISAMETDYTPVEGEEITGASHYFILENEEYNQFLGYSEDVDSYGWRSIDASEIEEPNSAGTLVLYMESIMDDTTGNNPHVGNGTYDDGMAYVSGMTQIFAYSILNQNFIGIDDSACTKIKDYFFNAEIQEDNRKCWFFSENYNSGFGKDVQCETKPGDEDCCTPGGEAEKIEFREANTTNDRCDIKETYEIAELLTDENAAVGVGSDADDSFSTEEIWYDGNLKEMVYPELYTRTSTLTAFNPEGGENNGEAAANSIVNLKNMMINFNTPDGIDKKEYRQYVEKSVLPYLTQMIPSTTIFMLTFDGEEPEPPTPPTTVNVGVTGTFLQQG